MSGAACPACGVAVVPGYVRCPKCRKPLPRRPAAVEGGTAVESQNRAPALIALAAAALVAAGAIIYFATRDGGTEAVAPAAVQPTEPTTEPAAVTVPDQPNQAPAAPRGPSALEVAAELERALNKQRLWSTVSVTAGRVDIRSSSCEDPAMAPQLDAAAPAFTAAGLTQLRCVEQSGRVVTDRDL